LLLVAAVAVVAVELQHVALVAVELAQHCAFILQQNWEVLHQSQLVRQALVELLILLGLRVVIQLLRLVLVQQE
jgi:hypothetical protein